LRLDRQRESLIAAGIVHDRQPGRLRTRRSSNGEPVDALLTRELHGLAYAHEARLAAGVPGFAEAVEWPFVDDVDE
jgi:hypothetical protein